MAWLAAGRTFLQSLRRAEDFDRDEIRIAQFSFHCHRTTRLTTVSLSMSHGELRASGFVDAAGRTLTGLSPAGLATMVGTSGSDAIGAGPSIDFVDVGLMKAIGLGLVGAWLTPHQ